MILLRPGAITYDALCCVCDNVTVSHTLEGTLSEDERPLSPGMKYKHYAPDTDTYLVEGTAEQFAEFVNSQKDCCAVCFDEESGIINIKKLSYGSIADESSLARNVFSVLRKVDKLGVKKIYIHAPSKSGVGLAVYNRLIRAAAFRVISL